MTSQETHVVWPVGVIKVESLDGIRGSRRHLGICDGRRVIEHLDDAFRVAPDLPRIEGPHANRHFHRRHFAFSSLAPWTDARSDDFVIQRLANRNCVGRRMDLILFDDNLSETRHSTTCRWRGKQNKYSDQSTLAVDDKLSAFKLLCDWHHEWNGKASATLEREMPSTIITRRHRRLMIHALHNFALHPRLNCRPLSIFSLH